MLHTTKEVQQGNTVYFEQIFYNLDGEETDPDSTPTYVIRDGSGTSVQAGSLLKRKDGYWYTYYTTTDIGDYTIEYTGAVNSKTVFYKKEFKVVENTTDD